MHGGPRSTTTARHRENNKPHRQDRVWTAARSPEQIANRIRVDFPDHQSMRISHEASYQSLLIEGPMVRPAEHRHSRRHQDQIGDRLSDRQEAVMSADGQSRLVELQSRRSGVCWAVATLHAEWPPST